MSGLEGAVRACVERTVLPDVEAWIRADDVPDAVLRELVARSYAAGDELARLRRDAPRTQIGEGAHDALLLALARPLLR